MLFYLWVSSWKGPPRPEINTSPCIDTDLHQKAFLKIINFENRISLAIFIDVLLGNYYKLLLHLSHSLLITAKGV